jgi:hypothetical protein
MARIALYGGGGAPFHHANVLARAGHELGFVFPDEIRGGVLQTFDAFVVPGGGRQAMIGQLDPLGPDGADAIVAFVEGGGMYLSSCAGSYCAAAVGPGFRAACPTKDHLDLLDAQVWNEAGDQAFGLRSPGIGVLQLRNVAPQHPVMAGIDEVFPIIHYNGPLFTGAEPLAVVAGTGAAFTRGLQFLDPGAEDDLIERAVTAGVASIVAGRRGEGRVVLFGSHPEFGITPAMDDPWPAARMLLNAVDWQLAERGAVIAPRPALAMDGDPGEDHAKLCADVRGVASEITALADELAARKPSPWLARRRAMSLFGREPAEVFAGAIGDIRRLAAEVATLAPEVPSAILGFRPARSYDGGYAGVLALLEQAREQLREAGERWTDEPGSDPESPYAQIASSPYHLVAASYLAAVGTLASAVLLSRAFAHVWSAA